MKIIIAFMPELPEVESIAAELRSSRIEGCKIIDVEVRWPRSLANATPDEFKKQVINRRIIRISRRGKYLVFKLSEATLFVHLRMTGRFEIASHCPPEPHERIALYLEDGRVLKYHDPRKFGKWTLAANDGDVIGNLGPEPLEVSFSEDNFIQMLRAKKRQIKPLLLDQTFIAGLGNIYADEALWRAQLHPRQLSNSLTAEEGKKLFEAIRFVLNRGLMSQGTTLGFGQANFYLPGGNRGKHQDALDVFRKTGLPCPRCGTKIIRMIVGQRSTHLCPKCQGQGL